jgi:hypothetical protein
MVAYDIHSETPGRCEIMQRRAREASVRLTPARRD